MYCFGFKCLCTFTGRVIFLLAKLQVGCLACILLFFDGQNLIKVTSPQN